MKFLGIGGVPCSGKTSLVRAALSIWLPGGEQKRNIFCYQTARAIHIPEHKLFVMGKYDGKMFDGTDRLSMAVQPHFEMMLLWLSGRRRFDDYTILFEGDRLFNSKTLRRCRDYGPCLWIVLQAAPGMLKERHQARGAAQTERFLRSRETKTLHLISAFPDIEVRPNWDEADQAKNLDRVMGWVEARPGTRPR